MTSAKYTACLCFVSEGREDIVPVDDLIYKSFNGYNLRPYRLSSSTTYHCVYGGVFNGMDRVFKIQFDFDPRKLGFHSDFEKLILQSCIKVNGYMEGYVLAKGEK